MYRRFIFSPKKHRQGCVGCCQVSTATNGKFAMILMG